jgi:tetratricopeptide (TPR) repeat protein
MRFAVILLTASVGLSTAALAQTPSDDSPGKNDAPPRSSQGQSAAQDTNESSSRDTQIDISPPKNDAKDHPTSAIPDETETASTGDVDEVHPFNPYRALRDNDVGDYYFKRKNYKAALARYQDALDWKQNDALANFHMAQCYEKLDDPAQAAEHYRAYLKILPNGPLAKEARKALEKLPPAAQNAARTTAN